MVFKWHTCFKSAPADRLRSLLLAAQAQIHLANRPPAADDNSMQYKACAKISASWECNLLVVASAHLVLCQVGLRI